MIAGFTPEERRHIDAALQDLAKRAGLDKDKLPAKSVPAEVQAAIVEAGPYYRGHPVVEDFRRELDWRVRDRVLP